MNLEPYVVGAIVGQAVLALIRMPGRVKEARVVAVRSVNDWQMRREFLQRRRSAALHELRKRDPDDGVGEQHLRDQYDDEADALRLQLERQGADAIRALMPLDRLWWSLSNLWDRTHEREEELDWAARSVRGIFDGLEGEKE